MGNVKINQQDALEKSIKHWERMIKWASKRRKLEKVYTYVMHYNLKEEWYGKYCELCKINRCICSDCILKLKYGSCEKIRNRNLWSNVASSLVWGQWVFYAKKFLKQLESLRRLK